MSLSTHGAQVSFHITIVYQQVSDTTFRLVGYRRELVHMSERQKVTKAQQNNRTERRLMG